MALQDFTPKTDYENLSVVPAENLNDLNHYLSEAIARNEAPRRIFTITRQTSQYGNGMGRFTPPYSGQYRITLVGAGTGSVITPEKSLIGGSGSVVVGIMTLSAEQRYDYYVEAGSDSGYGINQAAPGSSYFHTGIAVGEGFAYAENSTLCLTGAAPKGIGGGSSNIKTNAVYGMDTPLGYGYSVKNYDTMEGGGMEYSGCGYGYGGSVELAPDGVTVRCKTRGGDGLLVIEYLG